MTKVLMATLVAFAGLGGAAAAQDPLAANNGLYPSAEQWTGSFRVASLAYPDEASAPWASFAGGSPLTVETAPEYVVALKAHLAPTLRAMVETPHGWDPAENGWYDMVWQGAGSPGPDGVDPTSGREAILNTYSGQIVPSWSWAPQHRPSVDWVQNHAVIYYNDIAATMLARLWSDLYRPDVAAVDFPEGSISVKVEAVTPTPEEWDAVRGAALWQVFRPSVASQKGEGPMVAEVVPARAFQMSVAVKDTAASPETGWVYAAFVYDADAPGEGPWDRFVPLGVQWGNDPDYASDPNGLPPGATLKETWINPDAPEFTQDTLGWGGRLAGPMDVATRHDVITMDGTRYGPHDSLRVSSCLSCHGAAEFPFTTNLYPSPNKAFPRDAETPFLLYTPGSPQWARWHQNRTGSEGMTPGQTGAIPGLDYDMVIMFALNAYNAAVGDVGLVFEEFDVH